MADPLEVASSLALKGGDLISAALGDAQSVVRKSAVDLVTEVDHAVQRIVVEGLRQAFPDHQIVAEEATTEAPRPGPCWYVDPIDGTTNFVHGLPHCAVSIGLVVNGQPECAVVLDPCKQELFTAQQGRGAFLGSKRLQVSATESLDEALLVTGFPYDRRENLNFYLKYFAAMLVQARDVRRFGSAALDLCYVAAGRFDGFWEWNLHPWDTAAGWLMVLEAGGSVSTFAGKDYDPWHSQILASNGRIHAELGGELEKLGSR